MKKETIIIEHKPTIKKPEIDQNTIDWLEGLIERIKSGEIKGILAAALDPENTMYTYMSDNLRESQIVYMNHALTISINKRSVFQQEDN